CTAAGRAWAGRSRERSAPAQRTSTSESPLATWTCGCAGAKMASSEERRRILDLLAAGKVNADQAASLLKALGPTPAESLPRPPAPRPAEEPQRWQKAYEAAVHAAAERTRGPGGRPRFVRIR